MSKLATLLTEVAKADKHRVSVDYDADGDIFITSKNLFIRSKEETELILKLTKYLLEANK